MDGKKQIEEMKVVVFATHHANMDSFPFRFGVYFDKDTTIVLRVLKLMEAPFDQRKKVVAKFEGKDGELVEATFIIKEIASLNDPVVVTVYRTEDNEEKLLSKVIRRYRERGELTPEKLLALHPRYKSGELQKFDALVDEIVEVDKASLRKELEEEIRAEVGKEFEEDIKDLKAIIAAKDDIIQTQDNTIQAKGEELALKDEALAKYRAAEKAAKVEGKEVVLSSVGILEQVNRDVIRGPSSCTEIVLSDGTRWHMKTSTFDPDFEQTKHAETLIGKPVRVSSWDPVREPGKWSSKGYFRGVYEVDAA